MTTPADVIYREETHLNMNEWKIFTIDTPGHHPWCRRHSLQTMANIFKRMRCFYSERQTNVHRCASHAPTWVWVLLGPTVLHLCMRWCASWLMGQGCWRHRRTSIYEWNDFKPLCARGKLESSTYLFEGPGSGFPCVLVLSVIRHSKTSHRNGSGKNPLGAWCLSL